MTRALIVINSGSSSIKFGVYALTGSSPPALVVSGQVEGIGTMPRLIASDSSGKRLTDAILSPDSRAPFSHDEALTAVWKWADSHRTGLDMVAAGHRVVHGGDRFHGPAVIDRAVLEQLELLAPLAPMHQPNNLSAIRAIASLKPGLLQVACFDTAFHGTQPKVARAFALPPELSDAGIRRFGFHGLSYEYIAGVLPRYLGKRAEGRIVVAHLGSGASMCALLGRRSIAATTGFSALDGLPMGTRCGAIDPGVILYLLQEKKMNVESVSDLLYRRSGLLGVSQLSQDMRVLLGSKSRAAAAAIELFVYRAARELGSLAAALGGLDGLVFTGGIGERSPEIRSRICAQARWLGAELDEVANANGAEKISAATSDIEILAIPANEEAVIAGHTAQLLADRVSTAVATS
jgi:acetate kinase